MNLLAVELNLDYFCLVNKKKMVAEVITESPISISESALVQLQRIRTEQNIPEGHGLRVGVKGGGCSGFLMY